MKGLIILVAIGCFTISTVASASIHTYAELQRVNHILSASLSQKDLKELINTPLYTLSEVRI